MGTSVQALQSFCSFFGTYYIRERIRRHTMLREGRGVQSLIDTVQNLSMQIVTQQPKTITPEQRTKVNVQITRLGMAFIRLTFLEAQGKSRDTAEIERKLVRPGLLSAEEAKVLEHLPEKSVVCWSWLSEYLNSKVEAREISDKLKVPIQRAAEVGLRARNNILVTLRTPLPIVYAHMLVATAKITSLLIIIDISLSISDDATVNQREVFCTDSSGTRAPCVWTP